MTLLTSSFEGGSNGTTLTTGNSGGASGNAFDTVTIGANGTLAFDTAHAAHGTLACKVATGATTIQDLCRWDTSMGTQSQVWFRVYLYFTAAPASTIRILQFANASGSNICGGITVTGTGTLQALNAAGSTIFTTTASVPANAWCRVEGFIIGSATVGQIELKFFSTPDAATPTETQTSAANLATFGSMGIYQYGVTAGKANVVAFWMDDLGLSNTGYIGPAALFSPALPAVPVPPGFLSPASFPFPPGPVLGQVTTIAGSGGVALPKPSLAGTGAAGAGNALPPLLPPGLASPAAWQFPRYPRLGQVTTIAGSGGVVLPKPSLSGSGLVTTPVASPPLLPPGLSSPAAWQFPQARAGAVTTIQGSGGVVLPKPAMAGTASNGGHLASSTSAKALQRSAADKIAYLHDGSALIAYWNGSSGQVAQVTSPLTAPSVTDLITTAEDGVSLWVLNSGTSSDIWVCSSDDDASGAGPSLHVRHGTYSSGGVFTWDASTLISGTLTADTISSTITWNGTYLMVFWWDGTSGSDQVRYAWTADKTGTSGWSAAATLSESATWSTIVQVCARHSAKLGATVVAYGGNSQMHYAVLADSAASPAIGSWGGRAVWDQFDDSLAVFGGPQVVIDENSGAIHVVRAVVNSGGPSWDGVIYWMGTYVPGSPGSVSFAARVTVASGATAAGPADIAAACDVAGTLWVLWTDNTSQGNLKYSTVSAPFTSASAAVTLIAGGAASNPRWPHVPAVSAAQAGLADALPVLYTDTTSSPYPVILNTSIALPPAARAVLPASPPLPPGFLSPAAWQFPQYRRAGQVATIAGSGGVTLPKPALASSGAVSPPEVFPAVQVTPPGLASPAAWQAPRYPRLGQAVTIAGSGGVVLPKPSLSGAGNVSQSVTLPASALMPPGYVSPAAWQAPKYPRLGQTVTIAGSGGVVVPKPSLAGSGNVIVSGLALPASAALPPGLASPAAWQFPRHRRMPVTVTIAGAGGVTLPKPSLAGNGGPPPVVPAGSWWGLVSVLKHSKSEFESYVSRPPMDCPNDGEPLTYAPATKAGSGVERYCRYCGFQFPRDWIAPQRPG